MLTDFESRNTNSMGLESIDMKHFENEFTTRIGFMTLKSLDYVL